MDRKKNTKEEILLTALRLFAGEGYEAVSVSRIAGELGMVKSSLYKHYGSKRDIFDSIIRRMEELDYQRARQYEMPEGVIGDMEDKYLNTPFENVIVYTEAQFKYWTEEEFPSLFRKMLVLEQYRSKEMSDLYHRYLGAGPLNYMADLFRVMKDGQTDGDRLALEFYGPIFFLYSLYDIEENKDKITKALQHHIMNFQKKLNHYRIIKMEE